MTEIMQTKNREVTLAHSKKLLALGSVLALLSAQPAEAQKKGGQKSKNLAAKAKPTKKAKKVVPNLKPPKSVHRVRLDSAVQQFKQKRYDVSAATLHEMLKDAKTPRRIKDEVEYHLGKALYRLKLYQAALSHFTAILSRGADSSFYGPSLEWCLFIARKVVADEVVLDAVARHASFEFPAAYESEFRYLLSRFHYLKSADLERTQQALIQGKARIEKTNTGGKSFKGDLFGDEDDEPSLNKKGKSGLSLGDDIFGFDDDEEEEVEKKEAKSSIMPSSLDEYQPKDHVEVATRHVMRVSPNSSFSAKAKFVEAVLLYKAGKENDALEAFKTVVRLTKKGQPNADPELRQLAFFQLARVHFGASQPSFSLYYYEKMRRFTYEWLEALYESSWAEFRLGSYEKSLGNLLTLHSPFFEDQYFPESYILKAVVYYENCRYQDAQEILTKFLKDYEPVLQELQGLLVEDKSADQYYEVLANLREGLASEEDKQKAQTLTKILSLALDDPRLAKLDASYREVRAEENAEILSEIEKTYPELAEHVKKQVRKISKTLLTEAGNAAKARLETETSQIKKLIREAIRINIETAASEQAKMEASLSQSESETKNRNKDAVDWTDEEKIIWPFEDEYWRDELGTYQLTLGKSCR